MRKRKEKANIVQQMDEFLRGHGRVVNVMGQVVYQREDSISMGFGWKINLLVNNDKNFSNKLSDIKRYTLSTVSIKKSVFSSHLLAFI